MIGLEFILSKSSINSTELADKLGIKKQNISRWFNGERKIPEKYFNQLEQLLIVPQEYYQKELTEIEKLEIEKIILNYEIGDVIDSDEKIQKDIQIEQIDLDISICSMTEKLGDLLIDKTNGELEDIAYSLNMFLDIYNSDKSYDINFNELLFLIGNYLKIDTFTDDEDSIVPPIDFMQKYSNEKAKFKENFFKLLDYQKQIEKEYDDADLKFHNEMSGGS